MQSIRSTCYADPATMVGGQYDRRQFARPHPSGEATRQRRDGLMQLQVLRAESIEDLQLATGGNREFRPVQMGSRSVRGRIYAARVAELTLTYGSFHCDIHVSGTWSNDRTTVGVVLAATGVSLFGKSARPGDLVVAGKGKDIDARYRDMLEYVALNVRKADVLAAAEGCGWTLDPRILDGADLLRLDDQRATRLAARMRRIAEGLAAGHLTTLGVEAEIAVADHLLLEFTRGLAQGQAAHRGAARSPQPRPMIVRRIEDWLREDPCRPQGVPHVAKQLGVSPRWLYRAFNAEAGMSPAKYLRHYRMTQARLELLEADPARVKVTDVAVSWGFWELGRFAVQYRRLFGECPSQTLRS